MEHEPASILFLQDVREQVGATDYGTGFVCPLDLLNPNCPRRGCHDLYARFIYRDF
jgi:hypothetical protein